MIEQAELKDKHKHEKSTIEERTTPECEEEHRSRQKVPYKILRGRYTWLQKIDNIKLSDAREWAIRMQRKGFSYSTIKNYKRSLKASYCMAIDYDCVRKNPFDSKLSEIIENDSEPKVALSEE